MDELQELHAPIDSYLRLICEGCDSEGFESEQPAWPCRTATLIYSEDEIKETLHWFEIYRRWMNGVEYRRRMSIGWSLQDEVRAVYHKQILRQLESVDYFMRLNNG